VKGHMAVTTVSLTRGEALVTVNGVVVVASCDFGKGRVIYSGIPLENLTSESAAVWPLVFDQKGKPSGFKEKVQEFRQMGNNLLGQAAGYLPQLKTPPVPLVVAVWFIYVLVVGPALYLLLKRYDRRDWLWWLIPACALFTTGVVYLMSPAQRINSPISQTLAVVEIMDNRMAEINATAAFVSPYGGTLRVQGPAGAVVWPSSFDNNNRRPSPVIQYQQDNRPEIFFPDVEYWSMRQARTTTVKNNFGSLEGRLILDNGTIKGKIKNNSALNLRDCRLVLADRSIVLGEIAAGGSVEVNQSIAKWAASLNPNDFRSEVLPPLKPGQPDIYVRERQMIDAAMGTGMPVNGDTLVFLGWSESPLNLFTILSNNKNVRDYNLVLVKQDLRLDLPSGKTVELPPGMLLPKMIDARGAYDQRLAGYTLFEGKLTLGIDLDKPLGSKPFRVTAIEFPARNNKNVVMKIYDWQADKWTDLPADGLKIGTDELKRYRSPAGELRLQAEKVTGLGQPDLVLMPAVSVEGVVSR